MQPCCVRERVALTRGGKRADARSVPREESAGGDAFRDALASHAQLGVVGRTIHIVRPGGGAPGAVCASEVAPAAFSRIELASNMFSDHLPHVYEKAMDDLVAAAHGGAKG